MLYYLDGLARVQKDADVSSLVLSLTPAFKLVEMVESSMPKYIFF